MTLDPRHLHAIAALHSLAAVWPVLLERVEAGERAADDGADLGTLRSPIFGTIHSRGPARSAIADAIADGRAPRWTGPHVRLVETTAGTVRWLGDSLLSGGAEPRTAATLLRLQTVAPRLRPDQVVNLGRWIAEADGNVRRELGLAADRRRLTGARCTACRTRRLEVRVSNPDLDGRPYLCGAGCVCRGEECPCGMGVRVEGVAHIWLREQLVAAIRKGQP